MQYWKPEWATTLQLRLEAGFTVAEIATALEQEHGAIVTAVAVHHKIRRLKMRPNRDSVWDTIAGLTDRLVDLTNNAQPALSFSDIAKILNEEFGTNLTRNALIGKSRRLKLSSRFIQPSGSWSRPPKIGPQRINPKRLRLAGRAAGNVNGQAPARPTISLPRLRCVQVEPLHIDIQDLKEHHCRFPYGGDDGIPFTFCGNPKLPSHSESRAFSYCGPHHAITRRDDRRAA